MTALDAYLAREREKRRAYIATVAELPEEMRPAFRHITVDETQFAALLDAVELLAEVRAVLVRVGVTSESGGRRAMERIDAVLSRLTADSEGVGT